MAFLCPVRIRRSKKRKDNEKETVRSPSMGRITGSASIETLVRVGIEKEQGLSPDSKMVVLADFTPCVDDELEVKRGNIVNVLYQENDWAYVINSENQLEGFVPHSYLAQFGCELADLALNFKHKKIPRDPGGPDLKNEIDIHNTTMGTVTTVNPVLENSDNESHGGQSNQNHASLCSLQSQSSQPDIHPFFKNPAGRYIVLYTFIARDENDVSVERGEFVTVLNREDPDWLWIVRSDGQEGFVPSAFVYPAEIVQGQLKSVGVNQGNIQNANLPRTSLNSTTHNSDEMRYHGTELVMLYDYKAQAPDDLSVRRGDWIYADLNNQTVDGWLWAYAPKTRKYGFIPKAYARPPAMTSL